MTVRKKSLIIICVALLLVLVVAVGTALLLSPKKGIVISDTETVVYVNGSPITFAELKMASEGFQSEVVTYFFNTHGVEQSESFWNEEHGGETPNERFFKLSLDEAVRIKTEQLIMVDYGVTDDISYETYYNSFIAENKRRLTAIENNEIIYGPKQYTLKTYFDYVHNNRLIELKAFINKEVTGEDITDYSAENFEKKYAEVQKTVEVTRNEEIAEQLKEDFFDLIQ